MQGNKGKRDKKESKSAEKRQASNKKQMNLLLYKNSQIEQAHEAIADAMGRTQGFQKITDRSKAKSSLSGLTLESNREENASDTSGTPGYMAPEGKDRKSIREQILARQIAIRKSEIPEGWSIEAADFVNKLLQRRPMARLGWGGSGEVRKHAWLR
ncbi:unnamed protein product [Sphagnum balticum]